MDQKSSCGTNSLFYPSKSSKILSYLLHYLKFWLLEGEVVVGSGGFECQLFLNIYHFLVEIE